MPSDGLLLLTQLDLMGFLAAFWHAVVFEAPRFMLAGLVVGAMEATKGPRAPQRKNLPALTVSVLMPGHNEGASLRQTVLCLREQTLPHAEIIVIDDGSTDNMAEVGRQLKAEGLIDVFISTHLRNGKSAAANLGLCYCTSDVVVIADIDTSFDRDAFERLIEPLADPKVGAVSGNIGVRNSHASIIAKFQAIQYLVSISLGRRVTNMLDILFIASGAFAAFRREALESVGGWEVGPGEDADITVKLRRAGWKVRFQPHAWALTDVPETTLALVRQRLRWNRTLIRVRARKFRPIFDPFRKNFSFLDAIGTLDILYFQAIRPVAFVVYVLWLFAHFGAIAWLILSAVAAVYIAIALISFVVAVSVSGHHGRYGLLPYVPGYALFNAYVLRSVSIYAYLDELIFRRSYADTYVPRRVLDSVERF